MCDSSAKNCIFAADLSYKIKESFSNKTIKIPTKQNEKTIYDLLPNSLLCL